jgi:hypothetical protein
MPEVTVLCDCGVFHRTSDPDEKAALEFATLQARACATTKEHAARVSRIRDREQQERMQYVRGCVRAVEL